MEFFSEFDKKFKAQIFLIYDIKNPIQIEEYKKADNICILNPEIILDITHISIAIERAILKKKSIKRDIAYYSLESGKQDLCISEHSNFNYLEKCFIIFINPTTLLVKSDVEKMFDCKTMDCHNYSYFTDINKIKKLFSLKEIKNDLHSGLCGQIYNILSLKDLK